MAEYRGRIRGHEEFAVAETDDDRRTIADGDDLFRVVGGDRDEGKEASHVQQRLPGRVFERAAAVHVLFDEVSDDFGVGFGDERVAELLELALQVEVILDDAVVNDDDLAGAVLVRMCVLLCRPAVRGPSRVSDAIHTFERLGVDHLLEVDKLARAAAPVNLAIAHDRHARQSRIRDIRAAAAHPTGWARLSVDRDNR